MSLFGTNKCQSFFTYHTRKLDIKGISTQLSQLQTSLNVGVGEINLDPQFVIATEKLQALDLFQLKICEQINQLDKKNPVREKLRADYIETLMAMFKIAQNPSSVEKPEYDYQPASISPVEKQEPKIQAASLPSIDLPTASEQKPPTTRPGTKMTNTSRDYVNSLIEEDEIRKALNELRESFQGNNTFTLLLSQYATIEKRMLKGLMRNTDIEYKEFVSRLNDFNNMAHG